MSTQENQNTTNAQDQHAENDPTMAANKGCDCYISTGPGIYLTLSQTPTSPNDGKWTEGPVTAVPEGSTNLQVFSARGIRGTATGPSCDGIAYSFNGEYGMVNCSITFNRPWIGTGTFFVSVNGILTGDKGTYGITYIPTGGTKSDIIEAYVNIALNSSQQ